jgi:ADP-dependent NAD(P)H-hydrate dehydratase / NAD(P)H-hydrate epimerase
MKLVSVEEMRRIEQMTDARGHSYSSMMELAGRAVARAALREIPEQFRRPVRSGRILVLVGPGNNGGDGLVAARYLIEAGQDVCVYLWKRNVDGDVNFRRLVEGGERILWAERDEGLAALRSELGNCGLVIDAFLGTGAARPIQGQLAEILAAVRAEAEKRRLSGPHAAPDPLFLRFPLEGAQGAASDAQPLVLDSHPLTVLAVDCPSGLNCDTGALDPAAVPADLTVTFAYPKWGQLQYPGAGACGRLAVADIGVPEDLDEMLLVELVEPERVRGLLPPRPRDANKGSFGKALIAGGSSLYVGAPALSGLSAARSGAGLVTVALPRDIQPFLAARLLSLTWLPLASADGRHCRAGGAALRESLAHYDAALVGPGLTTDDQAGEFLEEILAATSGETKFVFDADALNLLAKRADWSRALPPTSVLTPHPGEMSRLTGHSIAKINATRISAARRFAEAWGHVVLLKGAHSVVAHPGGRAAVLPFADPALAKAGSGDVLAGVIVAMLAQGLQPYEAALAGGYVHGLAGKLAGQKVGAAGTSADDLVDALGESLRRVVAA